LKNKVTVPGYSEEASKTFYYFGLTAFTVTLLINQFDYVKNQRWELVITDSVALALICISLYLFLRKKIDFRLNCTVFIYSSIINLSVSLWYQYYNDLFFVGNYLFNTFIYSIYLVLAGFLIGRKHIFLVAGIYVLTFIPLILISGETYLLNAGPVLAALLIVYSFAVSSFSYMLDKARNKEMELKDALMEKDKAIILEHNRLLNFRLEEKQREIITKSICLAEYNENNLFLVRKLGNLMKKLNEEDQKALENIILEHRAEDMEKTWKEFEANFLEVHPDFYKKLYTTCPSLSPAELKLASLIRLGLSSKQIGTIGSTRPESVDVARSRLRGKLNLPPDSSLMTFLLNI
jgi:DNA-binding CsgD family transcriptional regulator